jgi:hypothetical protein
MGAKLAIYEIARLTAELREARRELDEARREVCTWQGLESGRRKEDVAVTRGWDCFPQSEEHTTISYKETP